MNFFFYVIVILNYFVIMFCKPGPTQCHVSTPLEKLMAGTDFDDGKNCRIFFNHKKMYGLFLTISMSFSLHKFGIVAFDIGLEHWLY
jgi:hypothetical protein